MSTLKKTVLAVPASPLATVASTLLGDTVKVVGKPVLTFDLSACEKPIIDAVTAQLGADGKWVKAADTLYAAGVRADMLVYDNEVGNADLVKKVEAIVVSAWSARVQTLLKVSGIGLAGLTEVERGEKRYWKARLPNMVGYLRSHLKKMDEQATGTKAKFSDTAALRKEVLARIATLQKRPAEKCDLKDFIATLNALRSVIATL
jgi:hypothetical protein